MKFPLWQYLNHLFLNTLKPIINPAKYWYFYRVQYLEDYLNYNFLEYCYSCSYYDFVEQHWDFIDRNYWEEGDLGYLDLCEYCWQLDYYRFSRCGNWRSHYGER